MVQSDKEGNLYALGRLYAEVVMKKQKAASDKLFREIIFLRHGKADARSTDKKDAKRKLTPAGILEFKLFLMHSRDFFALTPWEKMDTANLYVENAGTPDTVATNEVTVEPPRSSQKTPKLKRVIWTSPVRKAKETAEILGDFLDAKIDEKNFLETGSFTELSKAIKELPDAVTQIIIVGHEPALSDWCSLLSDTEQDFAKGSMAKFHITASRPKLFGQMLSYRNPSSVIPKGLERNPVKTILTRALENVRIAEGRFTTNPTEKEKVHQLRIKVRSLRSLLWFFKEFFSIKAYSDLQSDWGKFGRTLAGLREVDVLLEAWNSVAEEQDMDVEPLLTFLRETRHNEAEKTLAYIIGEGGWVLRQRTMNHIVNMVEDSGVDIIRFTRDALDREIDNFTSNIAKLDVKEESLASVHKVRIQAKRLRYVAESIGVYAKPRHAKQYKKFKSLQERIGELCDAARNQVAMVELVTDRELPVLVDQRKLFVYNRCEEEKRLRQSLRKYLKTI